MVYFKIEKVKIMNLLFLERKRTRQRVTRLLGNLRRTGGGGGGGAGGGLGMCD